MNVIMGAGKPPPDVKNFGDAVLAKKVIAAAAEGISKEQVTPYRCVTSLTNDDCIKLGLRARQCGDLQEVLMTSIFRTPGIPGLVVTREEERELEKDGFSAEFIGALAGWGGSDALMARIAWLRKNVVKYGGPENFSTHERRAMLEEMSDLGLAAADSVAYIMALGAGGMAPDVIETIEDLEKNPLARLSYSGKICSGTQWGLPGLIAAVQSFDPARRSCALRALQKIGRAAYPAAPILVKEFRRHSKQIKDEKQKELCLEIVKTFARVAPPTLETVEFYREVFWGDWGIGDMNEWVEERLLELLKTAEPPVRLHAFDLLLMEVGRYTTLKFYLPALNSSNATRRADSRSDLIFAGRDRRVIYAPFFFAALQHPSPTIRRRALAAIAVAGLKTHSVDDVLLLIGWLSHRDPKIRRLAIATLGVQGERAKYALPILAALQNDPRQTEELRTAAAAAVAKIEEEVL